MKLNEFTKKANISYILFEDQGNTLVGFNRYNSKGFIDDGSKWSEKDKQVFAKLIHELEDFMDVSEAGCFTYEVGDSVGLENKLYELGVVEMEQGW